MGNEVKRALVSVTDKKDVANFAKELELMDIEIISTGGTAQVLRNFGIKVIDVSEITGFPEMLDGRVKTLHPNVHGGILARRDIAQHMEQLKNHNIQPIDLVCINLYSFKQAIEKPDSIFADAIENIDIGGPCLIRASAKNHEHVTVVTDPLDYAAVISDLKKNDKTVPLTTRLQLAAKAFKLTSEYDKLIADYLGSCLNK